MTLKLKSLCIILEYSCIQSMAILGNNLCMFYTKHHASIDQCKCAPVFRLSSNLRYCVMRTCSRMSQN